MTVVDGDRFGDFPGNGPRQTFSPLAAKVSVGRLTDGTLDIIRRGYLAAKVVIFLITECTGWIVAGTRRPQMDAD